MASSYTGNSGIEKPGDGDQSGSWGDTINTNMDIIDRSINGVGAITLSGTTHTLTTTDGTLSDGMYKVLVLGGSPSGTNTITIAPNTADKIYIVVNSSGQTATFTQGSGANVSVLNGDSKIIYADGAGSGAAIVDVTADQSFSSVIIDGGTIDGTVIGGASAAAGTFTTVTASGEIDGASLDISGNADIDGTLETDALSIASTTVTSTAAELNYNDTGAAVGTVVASKTVTADANKDVASFRNITLTGELDAGSLDISGDADIDGTLETDALSIASTAVTSTAAELNYLDITTLGTSEASKAVTVDSSGDLIVPDSDKFKFGAGSDMQLYHDGTNSYITNGTGILKIATETSGIALTIGHTTSEVTFGDNVTITGDFTVNGTTTTINTTNLTVTDPLVKYGQGYTGTAYDEGFIITRGNGSATNTANKGFIWDESADEFAAIACNTEDGTTAGNVTINSYADLQVDKLTAGSLDISGDVDVDGTLETDALSIASTAVTSTAAELNLLDTATAGTTVNSKAVIYGSGGNIAATDIAVSGSGNRSITITSSDGIASMEIGSASSNQSFLDLKTPSGDDFDVRLGSEAGGAGGSLAIAGGTFSILGSGETMATFADDGAVSLYHNNVAKLATTSTGASITTSADTSSALSISRASGGGVVTIESYNAIGGIGTTDNIPFRFNTNNTERVRITNDGKVGISTSTAENPLTIQDIGGSTFNRDFAIRNGDATNYHRLILGYNAASAASGVPTNAQFVLAEKGGGYGTSAGLVVGNSDNAPVMFTTNATERARITNGGDIEFKTDGVALKFGADSEIVVTHVADVGLRFSDSDQLQFGTGGDLQISHDGSNSYIDENGDGQLNIRTVNGASINLISGSEFMVQSESDGAVTLYHNGASKIATHASGALMTTTSELQFYTTAYGIRASTGLEIKTGDFTRFLNGTTEHMRILADGKVGIGLTAPSGQFAVSDGTRIAEINPHSSGTFIGNRSNHDVLFQVNAAEKMRIDTSGNVAIGESSTTARLDVHKSSVVAAELATATNGHFFTAQSNDNTDAFEIYQQHGSNTTRNTLVVTDNHTGAKGETFLVRGDGTVLVQSSTSYSDGSIGNACFQLDGRSGARTGMCVRAKTTDGSAFVTSSVSMIGFVNGNGTVGNISTNGSATSFNTSSDYRLKENVSYSFDATTRLKQLKPTRFNFKSDADKTVDGFLAHEVSSIVPEAVTGAKDAVDGDGDPIHQSIDQSKLVPLLVKTIQELEARITALEAG